MNKNIISELAEHEVNILKNQADVKFILNKNGFNPLATTTCPYGQIFGNSFSEKAKEFKKKHKIITNIDNFMCDNIECNMTALEILLYFPWRNNKREQVYKIVETFATWKNGENTKEENLFKF